MSDKYEVNQQYGFTYTDCDGKTYKKEISTEGCTWMECLNDYVRFLESIFQYEIMEKVRIQEPVWMDSMYEHYPHYIPEWRGEYFTVEDEPEDELTDEYGWGDPK
jgi:hypothetical protein